VFKKSARIGMAVVLTLQILTVLGPSISASADSGLLLHWNFDEGSGSTALDSSGNSQPGTLFNNATYVPGESGTAVALNGVNQYVQSVTPLASLGTVNQPYALSAWVKAAPGVSNGNIVHISSYADGSHWCIPFLRLQNGVFSATGWNGNQVSAVGNTPVVAGQWYQVMTSWDPSNGLRLFVNGVLEQATPEATYTASGVPDYFSLGLSGPSCSDNQGYFHGDIDDAQVYNRALTPQDIQNIASPNGTDGLPATVENNAPNNGDANSDNIQDSQQANVSSLVDPVTTKYAVLDATGASACTGDNNVTVEPESSLPSSDGNYIYPAGLMNFSLTCSPGATAVVTMYYYGLPYSSDLIMRKYNNTTKTYSDLPSAVFSNVIIGGQQATKVTYSITDGGPLDEDGLVNGTIVDPAGPALATVNNTPDTGYGTPKQHGSVIITMAILATISISTGLILLYRLKRTSKSPTL
jgi:hypothetical protein